MKKDGQQFVPSAKVADSDVLAGQILDRVQQGKAKIPVWPEAAEEALKLSRNPLADLREIARVIATDTGLYAEILAVVNSPLYSRGRTIKELGQALVRLGLETTRSILMQSVVMSGIFKSKKFSSEVRAQLLHALHHAYLAKELHRVFGIPGDVLFSFGLLHDIGIVIAYKLMEDLRYPVGPEEARKAAMKNHAQIGALVLSRNNVPEDITAPIMHHAQESPPEEYRAIIDALRTISGLLFTHADYPADLKAIFDSPARDMALVNTGISGELAERIASDIIPKVMEGVGVIVSRGR